jgi:signal transduction histidine kinase
MKKNTFSLKYKLIIWLSLIGFVTSISIHFILIMLGSSDISYTMRQNPVLQWQQSNIRDPLTAQSTSQSEINAYLESLVNKKHFQVFHQDMPFTQLSIKSIAFIDLDSKLIFKTSKVPLLSGDVGTQIAIQSRDDLSDALTGHFNSGIEPLGENNYLVINSVLNNKEEIIGATASWQSWQYQQDNAPLFYISIVKALQISIFNTLASFFWILPSTFILGWLVARVITKRYQHLYKTIEDWGNGNLTSRITTSGSDEIDISFQRLNVMAEKLAKHQKELKHLVSIEERQHLAAELHDTVKQQLFASNLQLSAAAQQIDQDLSGAKESITKAINQNRTAFKQVNDLIFTLSPIQIGSNLKEALITAFVNWQKDNTTLLKSDINIDIELTEIQQQVIFRSIMEALQNISKHATAKNVAIELSHNEQRIFWQIADDGITDTHKSDKNKVDFGQGLSLMQKRIESLDGSLHINNNNGFNLSLELPIA